MIKTETKEYIGYCERCGHGIKTGSEAMRDWHGNIRRCMYCAGKPENKCGKPHNNGEESCVECEAIKAGI
jgi:hypothetical protein